jgi:hypothetical protein
MWKTLRTRIAALFLLMATSVSQISAQEASMGGFADIQNHQFANHFMVGYAVTGPPYGPMQTTLNAAQDLLGHSANHACEVLGGFFARLNGPGYYHNDGWPTFRGWLAHFEATYQKYIRSFCDALAASEGATARGQLSVHNTAGANFSQKILTPTTGCQPMTLLYAADATESVRIHLVRQDCNEGLRPVGTFGVWEG